MGRYLHLFGTEGEYGAARESDYKEPWVSLVKKSDGDVKSFVGEYGNGPVTVERQFNYFGSYGDDYVNTDIIESDITAIDGENQTVTVDGYVFSFQDSQDDKYLFEHSEQLMATETVESLDGVIEFDGGTYSACTVSGRTFIMDYDDGQGTYYWDEVDVAAGTWLNLWFSVDHETLTLGETVEIPMGEFRLLGYTSVEPAVGVLFKYIESNENTLRFISENGRHVQVGDTFENITVKSIVEAEEGETINRVNYNKTEYEKLLEVPLTFDIQSNGNVVVSNQYYNLEYKKNDGEWIEVTSSTGGTVVSVVSGDAVQFRGNNSNGFSSSIFSGTTSQFIIKGNVMSLLKKEHFNNLTSVPSSSFNNLFTKCTGLTDASKLLLPATTLANNCYERMFWGCTSLTTAPELPATTLARNCYNCMFYGCTSLTQAPELPATTLANQCYVSMFLGCTNLPTAPALPATTLANSCYEGMFYGCTGLATAPALPATTLANSCYNMMFYECTGLTQAPELPATTLAQACYYYMFYGCTSLMTAPSILPATTLASNCYEHMFQGCASLTTAPSSIGISATTMAMSACTGMFSGCTSLTQAPELPATTLEWNCYNSMFAGCTSLTTAPELPATNLSGATSCYGYMFRDCTSLTKAPELPATTLATHCYDSMFNGCTSLTTAPELPATTLANYCYSSMFQVCKNLTTAPSILPATTLAQRCYNYMFSGCTSLTQAPELPATTLEPYCYEDMFRGCTRLNYIKCLATSNVSTINCNGWVTGVSSTGTFVKAPNMTGWARGNSGIPTNWTVEDAA